MPDVNAAVADHLVRLITLEAIRLVPWALTFLGVAYLHAKWMRR